MPRPRAPPPLPSFDRDAKGYVKEEDVLHPVDKTRPDGEWPTFEMRNAIVYGKDLTTLEGLLLVEKKGPFVLRGRITVDVTNEDHTQAFLSTRIPRSLDIEVLAMRMSIGYGVTEEGGVPAVWAATNHGFFEVLTAAPEYKPVLDKTFEAITLYYTVMDIYEKHEIKGGKRKRRLETDEVLFRYAVDIGEAAVKEEIVDRCHEHAEFMANHFPQDTNFDWTGKAFASFIQGLAKTPRTVNRHPAISQTPVPVPSPSQPVTLPQRSRSAAHEGAAGPKSRATRQSSASASGKSQSPAAALAEPKARRGSSQPHVEPTRPAAPSPLPSDHLRSEATARKMYEAILDVSSDSDSVSRITIGGITNKLYFKYKFSVYKGAADAMRFYGQELVRCMENDSERAAEWMESPIYRDLSAIERPMEAHELQFLTAAQIEPSLCKRTKLGPAAAQARRKDPTTGEKPGKGPAAAGYRSSSESSGVGRPRAGRPSGKVAGLRLATAVPKKRLQSDYDSAASGGRASKSSKLSHGTGYEDENFGEGSVGMETDREESPDAMVSDSEPGQEESVRITIDVEDVPSTQPNGPDGTWVCDQEDCGHVVIGADDTGGQMAVREHLHEHEETSEKVKLAVAEGHAAGHRPIEYLLEKLKQIGGRELPKAEDDGRPEPIKRRHGLFL
ncbi:uncharacterized protein DNG_03402 [Cephalotrichum gorgonifer]|uniref:Uncharacterized protein n=1 Tax=Cephalotrichum gorgonifer TaxID=2041049 RepID=A0AAE8MU79_9PEZI|nr:uncharacterized protein DNG_03402 [Cephalotrichum gorgonifer]